MSGIALRNTLFLLFALSGFTGLIYESIWSHYLKLFLGHAAYAQALVLAIFMGGMALGAWLASRFLGRFTNLLIAYALIEGLIGVFGLGFHSVFQATLSLSYDNIIPALDSPHAVQMYKWTVSTLLILPQSILLGMTFPVMSNGIIRLFPITPGGTLGMLYFTNSIGAAIGVLVSGFVLIAVMGLPGTLLFAANVNIILAIIVYAMAKGHDKPPTSVSREGPGHGFPSLILIAAFITGAASFIYEISWLRMLSMVLGASTHSFELMLSAFITGLALGGLWIRRRIDRLQNPFLTAGMIQVIMGFFAIATLPLYNQTFDLMGFLLEALEHNESGYVLFGLSSHFIALLVMLPATFCAGMTLPLFTYILLHYGHGEKSVGEVYASNTLGAITGVVFTILAGLPLLGLKGVMIFGAGLDIVLGLVFIVYSGKKSFASGMVVISIGIITGSLAFAELDVHKMSSGVYRTGLVSYGENVKVLYQEDGRTSTVHVLTQADGRTAILTNGKSDATINVGENGIIADDEPTMALLAAIPLAFKPDSRQVANIGMGSGMTAHTLLAWPGIERVDTIEIEPAMVEGARHFLPRVERVFDDPRSHIIIEDAKTYFSIHGKKYDLILSEPSNPWVSGIASLFTDEFYRHIKNYLHDDGLFVQWIQTYEITPALVFTILKAIGKNFSDYAIFASDDGNLILLASPSGDIGIPGNELFNHPAMKQELQLIDINNVQDIKARFIADKKSIGPLMDFVNPKTNSDYFPILDLNSAKARYMREDAFELSRLGLVPVPLIRILAPEYDINETTQISKGHLFSTTEMTVKARAILARATGSHDDDENNQLNIDLQFLLELSEDCGAKRSPGLWIESAYSIARRTLPYLSAEELEILWDSITPDCDNGLTDRQYQWLGLFRALGTRDMKATADQTVKLLENSQSYSLSKKRFLFLSLLTALVRMEEYAEARLLWTGNSRRHIFDEDEIPMSFLLVYSHALRENPGKTLVIQ